jgi:hypothetical protein
VDVLGHHPQHQVERSVQRPVHTETTNTTAAVKQATSRLMLRIEAARPLPTCP